MPRVFACLAVSQLILLVLAGGLGLAGIDPAGERHILMAVIALLLSCLNQVVAFTYLTVTGKMIGQAVHLGKLDLGPLLEIKRLKRSLTFMLALVVISLVVVTATGAYHWRTGEVRVWHWGGAGLVLVAHGLAYFRQYVLICEASRVLSATLAAYTAARGQGLPGVGEPARIP